MNLPNWLDLTFRPEDGEWFHPNAYEILTWTRELDLKQGILTRTLHVRDPQGRETRLRYRRFVSQADPHLAGISLSLTPGNWTGRLHIRSALDGRVRNAGVKRYQQLRSDHLEALLSQPIGEDGIALVVRTNQSQLTIAQAARTRLFQRQTGVTPERTTQTAPNYIAQDVAITVAPEETVTVEKITALFTSRDPAVSECRLAAKQAIRRAERFTLLVEQHAQAWQRTWDL